MTVKEEEITVFTIDMKPDNGYLENKMQKKCIKQLKNIFNKSRFKIYTPDDEIVKQCFDECKNVFDFIHDKCKEDVLELKSDIVRIYILSKLKNHLYFDADIYLDSENKSPSLSNSIKSMLEDNKSKFYYSFSIIWNGNDFEIFEKIIDFYKTKYILQKYPLYDTQVLEYFKNINMFGAFNNYHYSDLFIYGEKNNVKYIEVDCDKINKINKINISFLKDYVFVKKYREKNDPYCNVHINYWGYIFDTFEEFKKFVIKNKKERVSITFLKS